MPQNRFSLFSADPDQLDEWFPDSPDEPTRAPTQAPEQQASGPFSSPFQQPETPRQGFQPSTARPPQPAQPQGREALLDLQQRTQRARGTEQPSPQHEIYEFPDGQRLAFPAGTTRQQAIDFYRRQQGAQAPQQPQQTWGELAFESARRAINPAENLRDIPGVQQAQEAMGRYYEGVGRGAARSFAQFPGQALEAASTGGWMREMGVRNQIFDELDVVAEMDRRGAEDPEAVRPGYRTASARNLRNIANTQAGQEDRDQIMALAEAVERGDDISQIRQSLPVPERFAQPTPPEDRSLAQFGQRWQQRVEEYIPRQEEPPLTERFGEALGTLGAFMGAGAVGGPAASFSLAGLMGAQEQYDRARAAGADAEERFLVSGLGQAPGAIQAISIEVLLNRIPAPLRSAMSNSLRRIAAAGGAEFTVETAGNILQNIIAQQNYDPEQSWLGNAVEQGILSGSAASTLRAVVESFLPTRRGAITRTQEGLDAANALIQGEPRRVRTTINPDGTPGDGEGVLVRATTDGFVVRRDDGRQDVVPPEGIQPLQQPDMQPPEAPPTEGTQPPDVARPTEGPIAPPQEAAESVSPISAPQTPQAAFEAPQTATERRVTPPQVRTPEVGPMSPPEAAAPQTAQAPQQPQPSQVDLQAPQVAQAETIAPPQAPTAPSAEFAAPQVTPPEQAQPPEIRQPGEVDLSAPEAIQTTEPQVPDSIQPPEAQFEAPMPGEAEQTTAPDITRQEAAAPQPPTEVMAEPAPEAPEVQRPESWEPFTDEQGNVLGYLDAETGEIFDLDATPPQAPEPQTGESLQASLDRLNRDIDRATGPIQPPEAPQAPDVAPFEAPQTQPAESVEPPTVQEAPAAQEAQVSPQERQAQDLRTFMESDQDLATFREGQRGTIEAIPQRQDVAVTPDGRDVAVEYAVVDVNDLVTSNFDNMAVNPDYPQGLQPRDRTRSDSAQQVQSLQSTLNPRLLMESPSTTDGAPIIGPDGIVESGNARSIALRRSYRAGSEQAQAYRQALADAGFDVGGIQEPALVRIRQEQMGIPERIEFPRSANESPMLRMGTAEAAMADAGMMTPEVIDLLQPGPLTSQNNRRFLDAVMAQISPGEASAMRTPDGDLSQQGSNRIEAAILARAYGDANLLSLLLEAQDNNIRAIGGAIRNVAPQWAMMRDEAAAGRIAQDMDQTGALIEAINLVRQARSQGQNVGDVVRQDTLWGDPAISSIGKGFLGMFFSDDAFIRPIRATSNIQRQLENYIREANKSVESLIEAQPDAAEVMQRATQADQADLFARRSELDDSRPQQPRRPVRDGQGVSERIERAGLTTDAPSIYGPQGLGRRPRPRSDGRASPTDQTPDGRQPGSVLGPMGGERGGTGRVDLGGSYLADPAQGERYSRAIEQLRQQLSDLGLTDRVSVEAFDRVFYDSRGIGGVTLVGRDAQPLVAVSLEGSANPIRTLRHEVIHALRNLGLITPQEWSVLSRNASRWRREYNVDSRWRGLDTEGLNEEAVAEAFADANRRHTGLIEQIVNRIRDFLERLGNALRGEGFVAANDIFQSIDRGEVGARELAERLAQENPEFRAESTPEENGTNLEVRNDGSLRDQMNTIGILNAQEMAGSPQQQEAVVTAGQKAIDLVRSALGMGNTPRARLIRDIGTVANYMAYPSTIAAVYPEFTGIYNRATDMFAMRDRITDELGGLANDYMSLPEADLVETNKALYYGSVAGVDLQPNEAGVIEFTNNGAPIYDYQSETMFLDQGETIRLTPAQTRGYLSARRALERSLEVLRIQVLREAGLGNPGDPVTPQGIFELAAQTGRQSRREQLERLARAIQQIDSARRTGYFPLSRRGDQAITVLGPENPLTGQRPVAGYVRVETTSFRGKAARTVGARLGTEKLARVRRHLQRQFPESQGYTVTDARPYEEATARSFGINLGQIDNLAEMAGADVNAWGQVRQSLNEHLRIRGWGSHLMQREGIPGFDVDGLRTLSGYIVGMSNFLANRRYAQEIAQMAEDNIPDNQPRLKQYARDYTEYIQQPQEEWQFTRSTTFVFYLGGNISSMAVNATQVPFVAAPYLRMFAPHQRIATEMAKAYFWDFPRMVTFRNGLPEVDPSKAPADMFDDFQKGWADGLFVPQITNDMIGKSVADRKFMRGFTRRGGKTVELLTQMYSASERMNRIVSYMMAHRIGRMDGMADNSRRILRSDSLYRSRMADGYNPHAFGRHVVERTQFVNGKVNRPRTMRGPGAAIFQFQTFPLHFLNTLYMLKEQGNRESTRAFAWMMAALMAGGGLRALPFMDDLNDFIESIVSWWRGKDLDIEQELYDWMEDMDFSPLWGEAVSRGAMRALFGVDLSQRVSMGQLVPRVVSEPDSWAMPVEMWYGRFSRAADYYLQSRTQEAAAELFPLFIKNGITANVWANHGIRTRSGQQFMTPEDLEWQDIAKRAIGFQPTGVTRTREREFAITRRETAIDQYRTRMYFRISEAISDGVRAERANDMRAYQEAQDRLNGIIQEVQNHNLSAAPEHMIDLSGSGASRAIRQRVQRNLGGAQERRYRRAIRGEAERIRESRP